MSHERSGPFHSTGGNWSIFQAISNKYHQTFSTDINGDQQFYFSMIGSFAVVIMLGFDL